MAVEVGNIITYSDLVDQVVNRIKSVCVNIDGYKDTVPTVLRSGQSYTLNNGTCRCTFTAPYVAETNTVSSSTVANQIN